MMTKLVAPPHVMHLIDDEDLVLHVKAKADGFRLRIWRAPGEPSVALVTPLGHTSPRRVTTKMANLVNAVYLAHDTHGFYFFELNDGALSCYSFVGFGRGDRLLLDHPRASAADLVDLESLVGGPVEM